MRLVSLLWEAVICRTANVGTRYPLIMSYLLFTIEGTYRFQLSWYLGDDFLPMDTLYRTPISILRCETRHS